VEVEWDPEKAIINYKKHGIHFADAEIVLMDPTALSMEDFEAEGEQRFIALGYDAVGRLLVVVYTYRGENIRIISARPATKRERKTYEERI
jgi:uncharacterized protein